MARQFSTKNLKFSSLIVLERIASIKLNALGSIFIAFLWGIVIFDFNR